MPCLFFVNKQIVVVFFHQEAACKTHSTILILSATDQIHIYQFPKTEHFLYV